MTPAARSQIFRSCGPKGGCEAPVKCGCEVSCEPACGKCGCLGKHACCNPLAPIGRAIARLNVALREFLACQRCGSPCGKVEPDCGCGKGKTEEWMDGDFESPQLAPNPFQDEDAAPPPTPLPPAASQPRRTSGNIVSAAPLLNINVSTHRTSNQPQATPSPTRGTTNRQPSPANKPVLDRSNRTASAGQPTLAEPHKLTSVERD